MTPLTAGRSDALRAKDFGDFQLASGAPKTRDKMRQMLSAARCAGSTVGPLTLSQKKIEALL
jgi:phage-related minor tail protein